MRLFIHALGASAGGGLTYLRNVIPQFAEHPDVTAALLASPEVLPDVPGNVCLIHQQEQSRGALSRSLWEQREIPRLIREHRADVLLCTGNFAIWRSPVPQILLSRNSLYTSLDFFRDLRERGAFRFLADTYVRRALARRSIMRAELTVAPSESFARDLEMWTRRPVKTIYHGFDQGRFFQNSGPLPTVIADKLRGGPGVIRILFVSHYNYYRNFETLFRGFALLKQRHRALQLVLTCELAPGANPGAYQTESARQLLQQLGISSDVIELGAVPYRLLHHVYRSCQIYVTPAYTETFAHPLVEAMASGLPIVASDLPVHREIADGAGLFFARFSPSELADKIAEVLESPSLASDLRAKGLARFNAFNWRTHVDALLQSARQLARKT